jgi:hypothetical protein
MGRARTIKADPGAGLAGDLRGEPYSAATIDGRRRCDTSRRREASTHGQVLGGDPPRLRGSLPRITEIDAA